MMDTLSARQEKVRARAIVLCELLAHHERDVLRLVAMGLTAKTIADELRLTGTTIDQYARSITIKTGISGRVNMARLALQAGIVSLWEDWNPEVCSGRQQQDRDATVPRRKKNLDHVHEA